MIKTQLCPAGELENKNWWYLDVVFIVLIAALSYYAVNIYIDGRKEDVQKLITKKSQWDAEFAKKSVHIEKFKTLKQEMEVLNLKIGALRKITTSKVDKVKPLVALDQLQTLWIDGVWYEELQYSLDGTTLIKGAGNDSLLIGEFMLGVRETMNPETRNEDIRTQIGFDQLTLKSARLTEGSDALFKDITKRMVFELQGKHVEKPAAIHNSVSMGPRPRAAGKIGF